MEHMIDAEKTSGRALHTVVGWHQPEDDFVPRCGAGEEDLDEYADEVEVSKYAREEVQGFVGSEEPGEGRDEEGEAEVDDAVGKPCENVEYGMGKAREEIGDVGAEQDGFKCG